MLLTKPHKSAILKRLVLIVLCIALGWYLKGKMTPKIAMGAMGAGTPYVLVEELHEQDVSKEKGRIAHVEAINSVNLQPKVNGTIGEVHFTEGSFVNEGDILFTIEASSFKATLDLRKAELEKAKAGLTEAERNYNRQIKLSKQNIASKATFDSAESAFLQAKAGVAQAEANLELAQISYNDTFSRAPINGYIGKALVTKGNRVVASTQTLAKIVQLNPIRITFTLTDKEFLEFKNKYNSEDRSAVRARITTPDGVSVIKEFKSSFADNEISTNTATVAIYGDFENDDEMLLPGSYVQIALILDEDKKLLIPQAALAQDENGFYTFVVNNDIAQERRLVLGDVIGSKQVVKSGLQEGDKVVIKGLQKLSDGVAVKAALVTPTPEL